MLAHEIGIKPAFTAVSRQPHGSEDFENLRQATKYALRATKEGQYKDFIPSTLHEEQKLRGRSSTSAGPIPKYRDDEDKIAQCIREKRGKKKRISRMMVIRAFLLVNPGMHGGKNHPTFMKNCVNMYYRFLRRHNLSTRRVTSVGQKLPPGWEEDWDAFEESVLAARTLPNGDLIPADQVGNMDQTPVYIEEVGKYTVNEKGESASVGTAGKEKERVTVELCVFGSGRKVIPNAHFKGVTAPKRQNRSNIAYQISDAHRAEFGFPPKSQINLMVNPKAYASDKTLTPWVHQVWHNRNGRSHAAAAIPSLLILDDFTPHKSEAVKCALQTYNTRRVLIKGGLTPKAQLMDRVPNKLFKHHMRSKWDQFMLSAEPDARTGKLPIPPRGLVATWIVESWAEVSEDTIIKCAVSTRMLRAVDFDAATRARLRLDEIRQMTAEAPDDGIGPLVLLVGDQVLAENLAEMSDDDVDANEADLPETHEEEEEEEDEEGDEDEED